MARGLSGMPGINSDPGMTKAAYAGLEKAPAASRPSSFFNAIKTPAVKPPKPPRPARFGAKVNLHSIPVQGAKVKG